ncbi:RNA polymerase sigma factor [bacterium]|nr:MAG: RNA polymerase sigma factor [bacterium]
MDDDHAVALLKRGDLSGLEPLIERYSLRALRTSVLIVQDAGLAEDVVQQAFVDAAGKIGQLNSDRFGGWFLTIVVRSSIKAANKQVRLIPLEENEDGQIQRLGEWLIDRRPSPEEMVVSAQFREDVWKALAQLTPELRAVVTMKYYLGMSEIDITRTTNRPLSTIKWRLYTARQKLRDLLRPTRADAADAPGGGQPLDGKEGSKND